MHDCQAHKSSSRHQCCNNHSRHPIWQCQLKSELKTIELPHCALAHACNCNCVYVEHAIVGFLFIHAYLVCWFKFSVSCVDVTGLFSVPAGVSYCQWWKLVLCRSSVEDPTLLIWPCRGGLVKWSKWCFQKQVNRALAQVQTKIGYEYQWTGQYNSPTSSWPGRDCILSCQQLRYSATGRTTPITTAVVSELKCMMSFVGTRKYHRKVLTCSGRKRVSDSCAHAGEYFDCKIVHTGQLDSFRSIYYTHSQAPDFAYLLWLVMRGRASCPTDFDS